MKEREEEREGKKRRRGQGAVMIGRVTGCVQMCKISLRRGGKKGGDKGVGKTERGIRE